MRSGHHKKKKKHKDRSRDTDVTTDSDRKPSSSSSRRHEKSSSNRKRQSKLEPATEADDEMSELEKFLGPPIVAGSNTTEAYESL